MLEMDVKDNVEEVDPEKTLTIILVVEFDDRVHEITREFKTDLANVLEEKIINKTKKTLDKHGVAANLEVTSYAYNESDYAEVENDGNEILTGGEEEPEEGIETEWDIDEKDYDSLLAAIPLEAIIDHLYEREGINIAQVTSTRPGVEVYSVFVDEEHIH